MVREREVPLSIKLLIIFIFFVGFAGMAFVIMDAGWTRLLLGADESPKLPVRSSSSAPATTPVAPPAPSTPVSRSPSATSSLLESARKSIMLVTASKCKDNKSVYGTGFVIKASYVATSAHVISGCGNIELVDHQGNRHKGAVKAVGDPNSSTNLAILKITDASLPALPLADQEEGKPGEKVQTIGYPLVAVASGQNSPSPSNEGVIASYDINDQLFYSQGMNINPGNSGGPVFLLSNRKVIGVAVMKASGPTTEGVGIFIPSKSLADFFRKKVGEGLS
jgi:S1-C subfamily serine protease